MMCGICAMDSHKLQARTSTPSGSGSQPVKFGENSVFVTGHPVAVTVYKGIYLRIFYWFPGNQGTMRSIRLSSVGARLPYSAKHHLTTSLPKTHNLSRLYDLRCAWLIEVITAQNSLHCYQEYITIIWLWHTLVVTLKSSLQIWWRAHGVCMKTPFRPMYLLLLELVLSNFFAKLIDCWNMLPAPICLLYYTCWESSDLVPRHSAYVSRSLRIFAICWFHHTIWGSQPQLCAICRLCSALPCTIWEYVFPSTKKSNEMMGISQWSRH